MHSPRRHSAARAGRRIVVYAAVIAVTACLAPALARADGDPASDVLVSQDTFLPWDAGVPAKQQAELGEVLQAAARSGFQIRVAVIASASDMGSITALWHQPQSYAQFLGEELSLVYDGRVLVVMPNGFGLYRPGPSPGAAAAALAQTRAATIGAGIGTATIDAVRRLAAADGHPLPLPSAPAPSTPSADSNSSDTLSWIVFAIGGGLIALAWGASVRVRPLHLGGRRIPST